MKQTDKRHESKKKKEMNETAATEASARLDDDVMTTIGRKLRAAYDDILEEPVPDRFLNLLDELDKKDRERT